MAPKTADIYDEFADALQVAEPILQDYGGAGSFCGEIATIEVFEDLGLVRQKLEEPGRGRVLVVDGGASTRSALLGNRLAQLAHENGWSGLIVHGCIRDAAQLAEIPIGIKALAASPARGRDEGRGTVSQPVHFAGVSFRSGQFVYADTDGILVAPAPLHEGA